MLTDKTYFVDIETVPAFEKLLQAPVHMRQVFEKKFKADYDKAESSPDWGILPDSDPEEVWNNIYQDIWSSKAALYPEYGKIVCVSFGVVRQGNIHVSYKVEEDEILLLDHITKVLESNPDKLVAHNGKGFDYPFINKRMIIAGMPVPKILQMMGKKPWDVPKLVDTQELWSMGVFNSNIALDALAMNFGLPSPKAKMSGSHVAEVWYSERSLQEKIEIIGGYCNDDVNVLASVFIQMTKFGLA